MKIGIIKGKKGYAERDIILQDIEYISDYKKTRLIGIQGKVYRLTAKSYTELKKKIA